MGGFHANYNCSHAGFCAGVRRAIKIAHEYAEQDGTYCTLGPIVHNDAVVKSLAKIGMDLLTVFKK